MKRHKITIIGAGNVGASAAHIAALKELGDIILLDIMEGIPQGKALDLAEANSVDGTDIEIKGTNSYADIADSDIVVITAGLARKPGMSRDDLLQKNSQIVSSVSQNVKKYAPNSIIIVVSNPLDAMVYAAYKATNFPKNRIMGMAGILDTSRYRHFIADKLNVSVENVHAMVLGGHGDQMIPLVENTNIAGIPLKHFLNQDEIDKIVERTRKGGIEIVNFLKTGSAYYAPGASIIEMVEAIVKDKKKILPVAALLDGEYGTHGVFIGVPAKLGKEGVEEIIEVNLSADDKKLFEANVSQVKELMKQVDG